MTSSRPTQVLIVLLAVLYPIQKFVATPVGRVNVSLADPVIAVTFVLFLFGVFGSRVLRGEFVYVLGIFIYASITLSAYTITQQSYFNPSRGLFTLLKLAGSIAYAFAIYLLVRRDFHSNYHLFAITSTAMAVFNATLILVNGRLYGAFRPNGTFNNTNMLAAYLLFHIFIVLSLVAMYTRSPSSHSHRYYLFGGFAISILGAGILETASRAIFAAGILGGVFYFLSARRDAISWKQTTTVLSVGGLGILLGLRYTYVGRRILAVFHGSLLGHRIEMWRDAALGFIKNPLLGIGLGQHRYYHHLTQFPYTPHNTYLKLLEELGVIGFAIIGWVFLLVFRRGLHYQDHPAVRPLLTYLIAILAAGMFHGVENFRSFWLAVGLLLSVTHPEK